MEQMNKITKIPNTQKKSMALEAESVTFKAKVLDLEKWDFFSLCCKTRTGCFQQFMWRRKEADSRDIYKGNFNYEKESGKKAFTAVINEWFEYFQRYHLFFYFLGVVGIERSVGIDVVCSCFHDNCMDFTNLSRIYWKMHGPILCRHHSGFLFYVIHFCRKGRTF